MTRFLITGGGTAGHTNPGIAVAEALVSLGVAVEDVHFVGGERGNEGAIVPAAGFSIDLLPGRGIQRRLAVANLGAIADLARGLVRSFGLVRKHRPEAVLCLGGYAAFGTSAAAVVRRVPLVVTEQNARASLVNRVMGRFANVCALPFPDTDLPKGVLTGNPILRSVRDAVAAADPAAARASLGLSEDRVVVAVWSGSLGARSVNRSVRDLAERWRDRSDVVIHHVVGRRDWSDHKHDAAAFEDAALDYRLIEYETRMPAVLAAADLAVCRSGASTVTELAVAGLPAILVPLPGAPRDHQRANSRELVETGAAILLNDHDLNGAELDHILSPLIDNAAERATMAHAASSVARPAAADDVAQLMLGLDDASASGTAKESL